MTRGVVNLNDGDGGDMALCSTSEGWWDQCTMGIEMQTMKESSAAAANSSLLIGFFFFFLG